MISSKLIPPPPPSLHETAEAHKFSTHRTDQTTRSVSSPSSCLYPRKVELVCNYRDQKVAPKDPGTGPETTQPLRSPLEPVLRGVLDKYPNYNFSNLDFIVSRSNLRDLFKLISAPKTAKKSPGELKFYVELVRPARGQAHRRSPGEVRGTVLLTSGTLQDDDDTEVMEVDGGRDDHGAEFLEYHSSTLIAENFEKASLDEATVVTYDFAGMRCMVKYAPRRRLSSVLEGPSTYQEPAADDGKCRRVRRKTKIRPVKDVDEWMQKVPHISSPCAISAESSHDIDTHEEDFPVMTTDKNAQIARDVEAWRLEQDEQLINLRNDIERLNLPRIEVDDNNFSESRESKSTIPLYHMPSLQNRQRGDSVSSTSSAHSQASTRSMVSSRSSVSCGPGDSSHFYHPHKRLQLLPTIASTPPNEVNDLPPYTGFDTPLSNIWYRMNLTPSLFDVEAVEPGELEDSPPDPNAAVVGKYRSTTRYQNVLKSWEKEHLENLNKLVGVLRKIRKAAEKAGRCKVVVESSGKIRPYRVKQSTEERETEIGRVSILPTDLLERWV